jgi:hypothetical protein
MTASLVRTAAALLLGSTAMLSQAATVNLGSWAYGDSWNNKVDVGTPNHFGAAGGFKGSVTFAAGGELGFSGTWSDFITYCVEIDESFNLPSGDMGNYSVVAGNAYSKWNNANGTANTAAGTAHRLGRLLSYVGSSSNLVDTAAESTSLQLAIWNVIYDTDALLSAGLFREKSNSIYNTYAETLLAGASNWTSKFDVYVLSKDLKQDFVLARTARPIPNDPQQNPVPEPASLALSLLGLAAAAAASRRRRA